MKGARRSGREHAVQVLYALDAQGLLPVGNEGPDDEDVDDELGRHFELYGDEADPRAREFAGSLARGACGDLQKIDGLIQAASRNWRVERMARVDRNILRVATYELMRPADVPARVVINEAIEVAKRYGTEESPAFVNGLLDRIGRDLGGEPAVE